MPGMLSYKIIDAVTIATSGNYEAAAVEIGSGANFALHVQALTGTSPDISFTYSLGITRDGTFVTPTNPVAIGANIAAADVLDFAPETAAWIKIKATNNNAVNTATLTCVLCVQTN